MSAYSEAAGWLLIIAIVAAVYWVDKRRQTRDDRWAERVERRWHR